MSFFNEQLRVKVQGEKLIKNHYQDIWNVFIENAQVQLKESYGNYLAFDANRGRSYIFTGFSWYGYIGIETVS